MEVDIETISNNILKNSISDIDVNVSEISKVVEDVQKSNKKIKKVKEKCKKNKPNKTLNKWSFWLNLLALLCPLWGIFCIFFDLYKYPRRSQGVLIFTILGFIIQLLIILFVYFRLFDLLNQYFILFLG